MRKIAVGTAVGALVVAAGLSSSAAADESAAQAPQTACSSGPYIVFFDWDKSDITPEAATILDSAIAAYGNCNKAPIMLAGHTDRSGSDQYNTELSMRRDESVRAYLTGHGLSPSVITSRALGETMPRVATADGVREAQNRRVEITYGGESGS